MPADSKGGSQRSYLFYGAAIFFAAFLLFQIELIIAKYILPWFGGTPSVWTTCMLVFQILLLAGYMYAHIISKHLPVRYQTRLHILLLCISFILVAGLAFIWPSPFMPGAAWRPEADADPVFQIIGLLVISIGMPFFLLATTSPLLQVWHAHTIGSSPYRLYAISNAGSLLGLLSYPFIIEPVFTLGQQAWLWFIAYVAFTSICIACAISSGRADKFAAPVKGKKSHDLSSVKDSRPGMGLRFLWLLLAACACSMFLATTSMLCQEISVIPFLWVLPLSLYLMSFILCFNSERWYKRLIFHPLYIISIVLLLGMGKVSILEQVAIYSLAIFVIAMILHGELFRLKPPGRYLTSFYLAVAGGGALGGIFVALIAPLIFPGFWEFQLCLVSCGILLAIILFHDRNSWLHQGSYWLPFIITAGLAAAFEASMHFLPAMQEIFHGKIYFRLAFGVAGLLSLWPVVNKGISKYRRRWIIGYAFAAMVLAGGACVLHAQIQVADSIARFRSFFGAFRIQKDESNLILKHGQTIHGWQIQNGLYDPTPTCYYATNTGIGILLRNHPKRKMSGSESGLRVGIVGLGTGTLAVYGRQQDSFSFYEIDPEIVRISHGPQAMFSFLELSPANIEVILGDGRLSLEREAERGDLGKFDILVLDAFSSDSIPTHLLTREAMEIYLQHLRGADSVIAFHITNRLLDLSPVLLGLSREFGMDMIIVNNQKGNISAAAWWVFLSRDPEALKSIPQLESKALRPWDKAVSILWTDSYSNLFQVVSSWATR